MFISEDVETLEQVAQKGLQVGDLSLETFKVRLDRAWGNLT